MTSRQGTWKRDSEASPAPRGPQPPHEREATSESFFSSISRTHKHPQNSFFRSAGQHELPERTRTRSGGTLPPLCAGPVGNGNPGRHPRTEAPPVALLQLPQTLRPLARHPVFPRWSPLPIPETPVRPHSPLGSELPSHEASERPPTPTPEVSAPPRSLPLPLPGLPPLREHLHWFPDHHVTLPTKTHPSGAQGANPPRLRPPEPRRHWARSRNRREGASALAQVSTGRTSKQRGSWTPHLVMKLSPTVPSPFHMAHDSGT